MSDPIIIDLGKLQPYEAGALFLTYFAYPEKKISNAQRERIHASLCAQALHELYGNMPDYVMPQTMKPIYAFRDESQIKADLKTFPRRLRDRGVAGRMGAFFLKEAAMPEGEKLILPKTIDRLSLNRVCEAVLEDIYVNGFAIAQFAPATSTVTYLHTDRMGTPQKATNGSKVVQWSTTYRPYGETGTITGSLTQNVRLPGQLFDADSSLYQNGFRDYMPGLGMYPESDPAGLLGGLNPYAYVGGNPLSGIDPWGLRKLTSGEENMISSVFGRSIWPLPVNVYNKKYDPLQRDNTTVTPDGNMYVPPGNPMYSDDYSQGTEDQKCHFMHEMTHVWQYQHGTDVKTRRALCEIFGGIDCTYDYHLNTGDWGSYGIEQQAAIISDYYRIKNFGHQPTHTNDLGKGPYNTSRYIF
jgi:RHS repeat-associated protein